MSTIRKILAAGMLALAALAAPSAMAGTPGCVGKMWNPMTDLDFRLMGGIKIAGVKIMQTPSQLGEPPNHKSDQVCGCKNGLQTGFGFGISFWMPSYINDMARQSGCLGFLGGTNILPGFISLSSGQEYNHHGARKEGVTNMQVHWAYADVTAMAGKALFERCNAVTGAMTIAYMTEPDFVFQNDVYSAIMTPQSAILASSPLLSQMTCGFESIANTLGDWRDFGVCAWKGARLPLSGSTISKDSAQVSNMDITVKYLTRSALMGTTLRTMGNDVICKPKYSPFYDPFQHRYQWSFPGKVSTRYNVDMVRWGMFIKDQGQGNMLELTNEATKLANVSATVAVGSANGSGGAAGSGTPGSPAATVPGTPQSLNLAQEIVARLPKPLNYPSREAGFMQVWEARQCCMMVLTVENVLNMIVENLVTMGGAELKQMYEYFNMANKVYQAIQDPIGAALGFVGDQLAKGIAYVADSVGLTETLASVADGLSESMGLGPSVIGS